MIALPVGSVARYPWHHTRHVDRYLTCTYIRPSKCTLVLPHTHSNAHDAHNAHNSHTTANSSQLTLYVAFLTGNSLLMSGRKVHLAR